MHTLNSVAIVCAFFAGFLTLGMMSWAADGSTFSHHPERGGPGMPQDFVHDNETIRLYLLYHNPAHGAISVVPSAVACKPTIPI